MWPSFQKEGKCSTFRKKKEKRKQKPTSNWKQTGRQAWHYLRRWKPQHLLNGSPLCESDSGFTGSSQRHWCLWPRMENSSHLAHSIHHYVTWNLIIWHKCLTSPSPVTNTAISSFLLSDLGNSSFLWLSNKLNCALQSLFPWQATNISGGPETWEMYWTNALFSESL